MSTDSTLAPVAEAGIAPSELAALLRINQETGRSRDRQSLLAAVARGVAGLLPADQLALTQVAPHGTEIDVFSGEHTALLRERDTVSVDSAAAWCMRERRPLAISSPDEIRERFPSTHAELLRRNMKSMLVVPLRRGDECLGTLAFFSRTPHAGAQHSAALLEQIGANVAIGLDNCLAYEQQQRQSLESAAMLEMNRAIGRHLDRDELFGAIAASLRDLLPTDRFGIEMPLGGDRLRGHLLTPRGGKVEPTQPHVLPAEGTACDWVLQSREWLVLGSREALRERFPVTHQVMTREGVESLCVLPLVIDERCRAALFFMAAERDAYTQVHRSLLDQVGSTVAVAIDHCVALEEVRELRDKLEAENTYLQEEIRQERGFGEIVGHSTALLRLLADLERVAATSSTVLILDEVGELPLDTQVKLLRVLQEQEFEPIGSSRTQKVDVRVISATNRDLGAAIAEGKFRRDLFYRLNVFPLRAPPLRDRREDIPLLAALFIDRFSKRSANPIVALSDESIRRLRAYSWPGNIRELQNVLERAVILAGGDAAIFEQELVTLAAPEGSAGAADASGAADSLEDVERRHIRAVLERVGWVVEGERGAAKLLELHPNTLRSRMQKLGIARPAR